MTDPDAENARDDQNDELLDEVDAEVVEDLDVDEEAEDVEGGVSIITCSLPPCTQTM